MAPVLHTGKSYDESLSDVEKQLEIGPNKYIATQMRACVYFFKSDLSI